MLIRTDRLLHTIAGAWKEAPKKYRDILEYNYPDSDLCLFYRHSGNDIIFALSHMGVCKAVIKFSKGSKYNTALQREEHIKSTLKYYFSEYFG